MRRKRQLGILLGMVCLLGVFLPFTQVEAAKTWDWPFPKVGEGNFVKFQTFGPNTGPPRQNGYHNGLDFGNFSHGGVNQSQQTIQAIRPGRVVYAGLYKYGLGTMVVTKNPGDNFFVLYQEFSNNARDILVKVGQNVVVGTAIGTRKSDHLHLGITMKNDWEQAIWNSFDPSGGWLDPRVLIKQGIARDSTLDLTQYYQTNPGQVGTLVKTALYSSPDFSEKNKIRDVAAGRLIQVQGMTTTSKDKLPVLAVKGGYLSAHKSTVVQSKIDPTQFHIENPKQIGFKVKVPLYSSKELTPATKLKDVLSGSFATVQGIEYAKNGEPRLKLADGYISASKTLTLQSNIVAKDHHVVIPKQVGTLTKVDVFKSADLKATTKLKTIPSGTLVPVERVAYTAQGEPRLKIKDGFIAATKKVSVKSDINIKDYHVLKPKRVRLVKKTPLYRQTTFNATNQGKTLPIGAYLTVERIDYASNGQPRLKVPGGYISAQKTVSIVK